MIAVGLIESELNPAEVELLGARAVSYQILAIALCVPKTSYART
jgi:hypothetical protein